MQTNAIVQEDKAFPSFGLILGHCWHCFPSIASCHSSCQSLIRTTSFRRPISHFSNFLTLLNETENQSDWARGKTGRNGEGKETGKGGLQKRKGNEMMGQKRVPLWFKADTYWQLHYYINNNTITTHWKEICDPPNEMTTGPGTFLLYRTVIGTRVNFVGKLNCQVLVQAGAPPNWCCTPFIEGQVCSFMLLQGRQDKYCTVNDISKNSTYNGGGCGSLNIIF